MQAFDVECVPRGQGPLPSVESRAIQQAQTGTVSDVKTVELMPFPAEHQTDLWNWLVQFPKANFDDSSPQTPEEFERFFPLLTSGARELWGVKVDNVLVGAMGFETLSPGLGALRGIVFDRSTHGSGAPLLAVKQLLGRAWATGHRKVSAQMLSSNARVYAFLKKLGAEDEGTQRAHAIQGGKPVDMRLVAFFAPEGV